MSGRAVLLPFGLRPKDGRMVPVCDVPRGADCGLVCPQCRSPLLARKGAVLQHHLAHAADTDCPGAYETMLHKLGKEAVAEAGRLLLPEVLAVTGGLWKSLAKPRFVALDAVEIEAGIGPWRADAAVQAEGKRIAVEILVTHRCTPEKVASYKAAGIDAFEIDLSLLRREGVTRADVARAVVEGARREWIANAQAEAEAARIRGLLREQEIERRRRLAEEVAAASRKIAAANFDGHTNGQRPAGPLGSRARPVSTGPIYDPTEGLDALASGLLKGWNTHRPNNGAAR